MKTNKSLNISNKIYELDLARLSQELKFVSYHDGEIALVDSIVKEKHLHNLHLNAYCVVLVSQGNCSFDFNGQSQHLHAGEVVLAPPGSTLKDYDMSDDFKGKAICLSSDIIHSLLGSKIGQWNLFVYDQKMHIMQLTESFRQQYLCYYELIRFKAKYAKGTNRVETMRAIIKGLLLDMCSVMDDYLSDTKADHSHGKILFDRFIDRLSSSSVKYGPVSRYAAELSITPKYLSMLCSKYSNRTATEWIRQYTKEDIRFNLCNTTLSMKEICNKMGFANISFFANYVHKYFGKTPGELRNENKR